MRGWGRAYLPDHEPAFHYHSPVRRGGALDVRPARGRVAPGVLFEVNDAALRALDEKEGVSLGRYARVPVTVLDERGAAHSAITYRVRDEWLSARHEPPTEEYAEIVRRGLRSHGIDTKLFEESVQRLGTKGAPVFVYGTLKQGHCRAHLMGRFTAHEDGHVPGTLVDLGEWPGLLLEGVEPVHGEVFHYDDAPPLEVLDEVEDFVGYHEGRAAPGSSYLRSLVKVRTGRGEVLAWTYVYLGNVRDHIPGGRWTRN